MDDPLGRGVGDLAAYDFPFVYQNAGINRGSGLRIIEDLINETGHLFSPIGKKVKALADLQVVITGEDPVGFRIGNGDGPGFFGNGIDAPTVGG